MGDWDKRLQYFNENIRPQIKKRVSHRVELLLARAYMRGDLEGPIEDIEDVVLERVWGLGPGTLREIRQVIPAPK